MARRTHLALATALGFGVAAVGFTAIAEATPGRPEPAVRSVIKDVLGKPIGSLTASREAYGKSRITVKVWNVPAGYHGFHIHATATCDPKAVDPVTKAVSPFFTAGGHLDLTGGTHGGHTGDLPPLLVGADGTGTAEFTTDRFRVAQLTDADGSAIIVHALPDNLANVPDRYTHPADATGTTGPDAATRKTGDSGGRIGCGLIT